MHDHSIDAAVASDSFDIYLSEISKIEGAASLALVVRNNTIKELKFSISEWKRFYTQAIRGKHAIAIPQLVARICGTCSNAHLLASIIAIENAYRITPSPQTVLLRKLLYNGLILRDHALHLYIFALPDLFGKNSLLDFDENDPVQHELLDDAFEVKEVGNLLSIVIGGRSVHAPYPTIGGFTRLPALDEIKQLKSKLTAARPKVLHLIDIFAHAPFTQTLSKPIMYSCLKTDDFSFLTGVIQTSTGAVIQPDKLGDHLDGVIIPYSHARGFTFEGNLLMTGAMARLNIMQSALHQKTRESVQNYLSVFPSQNIFHNNLAQAIEVLHVLDVSIDTIDSLTTVENESPVRFQPQAATGIGVIEAPRGTLYYKLDIDASGVVIRGDIIVPTGQNQIVMERGIYELVEKLLPSHPTQEIIINEIEKFIRAFDPCMSCAAHFLKVKWNGKYLQ